MINLMLMKDPVNWPGIDDFLSAALYEDVGPGDVTTEAVVDPEQSAVMEWTAGSDMIVCGLFVAERVFKLLDSMTAFESSEEGVSAEKGGLIFKAAGPARALLTGERTALNLVQRMSGIATLTRRYVDAVSHTKAKIAATRKTAPGMRRLDKYAVTAGGGFAHRFGLADGVLIKDNHIAVAGSVMEAVKMAKAKAHHLVKVQVEVTSIEEGEQALAAGADLLLLDNMETDEIKRAVEKFSRLVPLEASGNMTLDRAAEAAAAGVDYISVGALTHSAPAADISARILVREQTMV